MTCAEQGESTSPQMSLRLITFPPQARARLVCRRFSLSKPADLAKIGRDKGPTVRTDCASSVADSPVVDQQLTSRHPLHPLEGLRRSQKLAH